MKSPAIVFTLLLPIPFFAQAHTKPADKPVASTPPSPAVTVSNAAVIAATVSGLVPRNVGPTAMGGRIADIAVYEKQPRIFYVASAEGGLWKTENDGITFTPT